MGTPSPDRRWPSHLLRAFLGLVSLFLHNFRVRPHSTSMSCVALLGVLPRTPCVISEITAAPEAQLQPATSLLKRESLGASTQSCSINNC